MTRSAGLLVSALLLAATGCPPPCGAMGQECCEDGPACQPGLACTTGVIYTCEPADPLFPADYEESYTEVRDCRLSVEHDFVFIRVLANDVGAEPYLSRTDSLPDGSIYVKAEYSDSGCTDLIGWTVMAREEGVFPELDDWHFQSLASDRSVVLENDFECFNCHLEECGGMEGVGFDGTCADP